MWPGCNDRRPKGFWRTKIPAYGDAGFASREKCNRLHERLRSALSKMVALRFWRLWRAFFAQAIAPEVRKSFSENSYICPRFNPVNFPASVVLTNALATAFNA
jgi:hypothetical protein